MKMAKNNLTEEKSFFAEMFDSAVNYVKNYWPKLIVFAVSFILALMQILLRQSVHLQLMNTKSDRLQTARLSQASPFLLTSSFPLQWKRAKR